MKKIFILTTILVFWGCDEESDDVLSGYTSTDSELDPTVWEGTDNLDDDKIWQFNFWNINGNLMWRFMDTCENSCGGSPYTLNTNVTPNEIDLIVSIGCMEESYEGLTAKGIIDIQKENIGGTISFSGLTIAISEPGSDSRPSSFTDAYRVWTLDYVDIDDIFYEDDFLVVDCDEDDDLSDEAECGGNNDSDVGICGDPDTSGCIDNIGLFDPTGHKFYNTSETVYDSETECSGSTQTSDVDVNFSSTYYEFFSDDGMDSNSSLNWGSGPFEYCTFDSSLYIYWFMDVMGTPTEYGITFTMTSDSTFYRKLEARCVANAYDETPEDCSETNDWGGVEWKHCTISHWSQDE